MSSLTIKNIPDDLLDRLRKSAEAARRSLNSEVIQRLELSVGRGAVDVESLLEDLRLVRERPRLPYLTEQAVREAREHGRA
jgi:plasmid stability protein